MFRPEDYPDLLLGLESPDDAAVWRLDADRALVVTTDFFTPVVDDPYAYGSIAAANALSDLYAMGAKPIFALNVVAMPLDLPTEIVAEILRGGADKVREAGAVVAGGHSIQDKEPKYGLVAVGLCRPERLMTKGQGRVGDTLVLTKPLGTGVTTTALKAGQASAGHVEEAMRWMARLNAPMAEIAVGLGLNAATDVTGFGLLGHGLELANASSLRLQLHLGAIPFLEGAREYAEAGHFPGGSVDNRLHFSEGVTFPPSIDELDQGLLFDAQTSGGLLLCVPGGRLGSFRRRAESQRLPFWEIGTAIAGEGIEVLDSPFKARPDS